MRYFFLQKKRTIDEQKVWFTIMHWDVFIIGVVVNPKP